MTSHLRAGLALLAVLALLTSWGGGGGGAARADVAARTVPVDAAASLPKVVQASRALGTELLAFAPRDGNVVVSPSSLVVALSMLTEGARGTSLAELEKALGAGGEDRKDALAALRGALLALDGDPKAATAAELPDRPIVHLADQVVIDDGFTVDDDFLRALADVYDAGIRYTDLGTDAGKKVLDDWADHHTGGLIKKSVIEPAPDLRLVFQDALLLAARWQSPFSARDSGERDFTLPDGKRVGVKTMSSIKPAFAYAELDGWKAARLPYVEALHADVILPPEGVDPGEVTPEILAGLDAALSKATPEPLDLTLPVLDVKGTLDLLPAFPTLGLTSLSCDSGAADLSGIALKPGELCVSQAAQQTVLKVDEEGTVAAALTEIGVTEASAPLAGNVLHLDRPFVFTVSHTSTEWPLFFAAIRNPQA